MPRPLKRRRICAEPSCGRFGPMEGACVQRPMVTMALDEFESIRLIDLEGLTQEECAARMNVARTTVQAVYASARAKVAECLVNEKEDEKHDIQTGVDIELTPMMTEGAVLLLLAGIILIGRRLADRKRRKK